MTENNKLYEDLFELVEPRMLGDFCGYDEEKQAFNIIKALKEILETKELECEKLRADWYDTNEQLKDYKAHYERIVEQHNKIVEQNESLQNKLKAQEQESISKSTALCNLEDKFACELQARLYHQNEWLKFSKENECYKQALKKIEGIAKEVYDKVSSNWNML